MIFIDFAQAYFLFQPFKRETVSRNNCFSRQISLILQKKKRIAVQKAESTISFSIVILFFIFNNINLFLL